MFPTLKRLQWSMMHKHSKKHKPRLEQTIARLAGRNDFSAAEEVGSADDDSSSSESSSSSYSHPPLDSAGEEDLAAISSRSSSPSSTSTKDASSVPLIEINLRPSDLQRILKKAPSPAVRSAWLSGGMLPDQQRRLLLRESRALGSGRYEWGMPTTSMQDLYDEGREWWEERARQKGGLRGNQGRGAGRVVVMYPSEGKPPERRAASRVVLMDVFE